MQSHNPYAPPQQVSHAGGALPGGGYARLDGDRLVLDKSWRLPDVCVKCAATQPIVRKKKNYSFVPWHGRMFGVIGVLVTQKKAPLDVPLCPPCATRASNATIAMWLACGLPVVVSLALILGGGAADSPAAAFAGVVLLLLALVVGLVLFHAYAKKYVLPQAVHIDKQTITLARVHPHAAQSIVQAAAAPPPAGYAPPGYSPARATW
jgi:hypothetical protein